MERAFDGQRSRVHRVFMGSIAYDFRSSMMFDEAKVSLVTTDEYRVANFYGLLRASLLCSLPSPPRPISWCQLQAI